MRKTREQNKDKSTRGFHILTTIELNRIEIINNRNFMEFQI